MQVNWSDLKGGFRGFEKLALVFVKSEYKNSTWEKTGETRDGNKDATAYIFGYKSNDNEKAQWWMEAKYSTSKNLVTRYRLDATIVSAILQGNVNKIIFVTNIAIRAKTIIDIRTALTKATSCNDVAFCTKPILENWLCRNPKIYEKEFKSIPSGDFLTQTERLYLTQEIDFYPISYNPIAFTEPSNTLRCNNHYIGYFSVFCEDKRVVTLKKNRKCHGISICGKRKFALKPGNNQIKFEISISSILPDAESFYFFLDNIEVYPAQAIRFAIQGIPHYNLPSQAKIVERISNSGKLFLRTNHCEYCAISAVDGSGKTDILNQLASKPVFSNEYIFYQSFSYSDIANSGLVVDFILFLLFPYLSPNEIDVDYLNRLGNSYNADQISELIGLRNDYNKLVDFLTVKCTPEYFFPANMNVNSRIVYLDNVHFLSEPLFGFFTKLMDEIQTRKLPVFMVFTVDRNTLQKKCWKELTSHCAVNLYRLQLTIDDIATILGTPLDIKESYRNLIESGNLTAIEMFTFAQYMSLGSSVIENTDQLIATLRIFQYSNFFYIETISKFKKIFKQYPASRTLCNSVYSSYSPIQIDSAYSNEISALIENDLLNYDLYNRLVPRSETVRECYRKNFGISFQEDSNYTSREDFLRAKLESERSSSRLCEAAEEIIALENKKQYNAVIYIGRSQLESEEMRSDLENRMKNSMVFLQLYFAYAYAAHMQSSVENPREHFELIISRCKKSVDYNSIELCLRAQWELANSDFENFRYNNVIEDVNEGIKTLAKMRQYNLIDSNMKKCLQYHDFMSIKCFVRSEFREPAADVNSIVEDCKNFNFINRYYNTKIRLALTQIVLHPEESLRELETATAYFQKKYDGEHKMYLFGEFSCLFYRMILRHEPHLMARLEQIHDKMKLQQHNNYRKRNFAIATYCFWKGDVEKGNKYLLSEIFMTRKLARRAVGFYYETVALYNLRKLAPQQAIDSLNQALEIFSAVESYAQIPRHNIMVLSRIPIEEITVKFWQGEVFCSNTYYLDLRISW